MTIAVVGSEMFSIGFDLIGIQDIFEADEANGSETIEGLLYSKEFKLIIVEEKLMDALPRQTRYRVVNNSQPIFVVVGPDAGKVLNEKVKRAVGLEMSGGEGR
jgi:vacuolar-type H+-ATPase subunit F/Vma7